MDVTYAKVDTPPTQDENVAKAPQRRLSTRNKPLASTRFPTTTWSTKMKALKTGATQTFRNAKDKLNSLNRRLKVYANCKQYRIVSSSCSPCTPVANKSCRTPLKMYSPFGIDTPVIKRVMPNETSRSICSPATRSSLIALRKQNLQLQAVADDCVLRASLQNVVRNKCGGIAQRRLRLSSPSK